MEIPMSVQLAIAPTTSPAALFPGSLVQPSIAKAALVKGPLRSVAPLPVPREAVEQPCGIAGQSNFAGALPLPGSSLHLTPEQEIYGEGDEAQSVYQVVTGVVRTCKFLDDGRRQIDAFYVAGDLFGIEPGGDYRLSAEAVGEVTLVCYRRGSLQKLASQDAAVLPALFAFALQEMARAQDHAHLLGRKGAMEKVASFLVAWAKRHPAGNNITLAMTRQDMADYLGLTIETVSRSLSQLERDKVIELSTARQLRVKDRAALRLLAA
jgi:CRP/FNR family nitrogen fixation transcriptional regulator